MSSLTGAVARDRLGPRRDAWLARILTRERATLAELGVYALVLAVLATALLIQHVINAGFYSDDWAYQANWESHSHGSFWHGLSWFLHNGSLSGRPTLAVYLALLHQAFGAHQERYLAWAVVLAVLFSLCVYLLLRTLRMRPLEAGSIGLLVLVFPASDSTRIWSMISDAQVAMSLVLLGATCSIASLSAEGRRATWLRGGGIALTCLGVTTYELTFVALLCQFVLYIGRAPRRQVIRAALVDWFVLALVYLLILSQSTARHLPISQAIDHGRTVFGQMFTLFAKVVLPFSSTAAGLVAAGLILAGAGVAVYLLPAGDPTRAGLMRWLRIAAIAALMTGAAYVIYGPSDLFYEPLAAGLLNRTNAFGALPMVVLLYSLAAMLGWLAFGSLRRGPAAPALAAAALVIPVGIGYTAAMAHHMKLWDSGYTRAEATLHQFRHRVASLPPGAMVVFYGQPIQETPDIPVWSHNWDLEGAIRLAYGDPSLRGRPAPIGSRLVCGSSSAELTNVLYPGFFRPGDGGTYGRLYLYNSLTGAVYQPADRQACQRAVASLPLSPWVAGDPGADDPA